MFHKLILTPIGRGKQDHLKQQHNNENNLSPATNATTSEINDTNEGGSRGNYSTEHSQLNIQLNILKRQFQKINHLLHLYKM